MILGPCTILNQHKAREKMRTSVGHLLKNAICAQIEKYKTVKGLRVFNGDSGVFGAKK